MRIPSFHALPSLHLPSCFPGPRCNEYPASISCRKARIVWRSLLRVSSSVKLYSASLSGSEFSNPVEDLQIPENWLIPVNALKESNWLRDALLKWLDEEYCPEDTNREISRVAAESYHQSLLGSETDLGSILLKMARDLESISYKESFHGAFSSANAAIDLISQRIHLRDPQIDDEP